MDNGNIPFKDELKDKYTDINELFSSYEKIKSNSKSIYIKKNIKEINGIDLNVLSREDCKILTVIIFNNYHKTNIFINDKNKIMVSKRGLREMMQKIYEYGSERKYLKEHLLIISRLGEIIENATLISQSKEIKQRTNINHWNYYFDGVIIGRKKFMVIFDVRSLKDGQNQFRVLRIKEKS